MPCKSPLHTMKKVRKYSDGGEVYYFDDWGPVDSDTWEGAADLSDFEYIPEVDGSSMDLSSGDIDFSQYPVDEGLALLMSNGIIPTSEGGDAMYWLTQSPPQIGVQPVAGQEGVDQTDLPPLQRIEIPDRGGVVTVDARGQEPSALEQVKAYLQQVLGPQQGGQQTGSQQQQQPGRAQQQEQPINWFETLAKLGLTGLGAYTSYGASKDARERAERYDAERRAFADKKNAAYEQSVQRLNLPGGYAALTPAATAFRAPK